MMFRIFVFDSFVMDCSMFSPLDKFEVAKAIIKSVAILMVNNFFRLKGAV